MIHHDPLNVFGEEVTHGALNQVWLLEHTRGHGLRLDAFLHAIPLFEQQGEVAHEVTLLLAFTDRTHDDAHAVWNVEFTQNLLQAQAFLRILNLPGNTALIRVR
jgi:hypothetical protein